MDLVGVQIIQVLSGIASLALMGVGLAVIFGMMRVINFAHGEFMMLGGYVVIVTTEWGVNIWIAMLVIAPVFVGIVGLFFERVLIRFLYGRMIDTLIATWGLSLFLIGVITAIFGNVTKGVQTPLGSYELGDFSQKTYTLVMIAFTVVIYAVIFIVLRRSKLGLVARGTMQNPNQASCLGISPPQVYMVTFGIGAALTGLAGAILAPLNTVIPTIGVSYVAQAFITVITGGAAAFTGTVLASGAFGTVREVVSYTWTPILGQVFLLILAVVLLRIFPRGITGRFFRRSL
jgi:branched-chain amino acid transport system permease protein